MESLNNAHSRRKISPLKTPSKRQKLSSLSKEELNDCYKNLIEKNKRLDIEISTLAKKHIDCDLNAEMQALHTYNVVKDLTQIVLGYIADVEHSTVTELHEIYHLPTN